mmetsp:Transcript_49358/g.132493  ORF Transcript_49358/g.132493 Transcript_49358/m.132493 type:complete len:95 (+) Transcript_49358:1521-1805(+)
MHQPDRSRAPAALVVADKEADSRRLPASCNWPALLLKAVIMFWCTMWWLGMARTLSYPERVRPLRRKKMPPMLPLLARRGAMTAGIAAFWYTAL